MSAIRPDLPPAIPAATPASTARAAQAAFFRAALTEAQATPAPRIGTAPETDAPRPSRPGALLDIRV